MPEVAVGRDQVDREEVVDGEAVLAHEVAEPAAEGEAAEAGVADDAAGGGEAVRLGGAVELSEQHPASGRRCARLWVDSHRLHVREIDHEAPVAHGVAGDGMAAAAHRHLEVVFTSKADRGGDVVSAGAAHDQTGLAVDCAVPNLADLLVALFVRLQQRAANLCAQLLGEDRVDAGHRDS